MKKQDDGMGIIFIYLIVSILILSGCNNKVGVAVHIGDLNREIKILDETSRQIETFNIDSDDYNPVGGLSHRRILDTIYFTLDQDITEIYAVKYNGKKKHIITDGYIIK